MWPATWMSQRSRESHVITPRESGKIEPRTERNKSGLSVAIEEKAGT